MDGESFIDRPIHRRAPGRRNERQQAHRVTSLRRCPQSESCRKSDLWGAFSYSAAWMTKLLQRAFDEASKPPEDEQDALGRILLEELASERRLTLSLCRQFGDDFRTAQWSARSSFSGSASSDLHGAPPRLDRQVQKRRSCEPAKSSSRRHIASSARIRIIRVFVSSLSIPHGQFIPRELALAIEQSGFCKAMISYGIGSAHTQTMINFFHNRAAECNKRPMLIAGTRPTPFTPWTKRSREGKRNPKSS